MAQRPEDSEALNHKVVWGKSIPSSRSSQCKGPVAGVGLVYSEIGEEAGVAGAEGVREKVRGETTLWTL